MNERERWIVYPLLFLALGAALRDKLFDQTTTRRIVCQELTVVDEAPVGAREVRVLAKIGKHEGATSGAPPVGYLFVDGQLEVDGPIVARQFGTVGAPAMPVQPGASAADFLRALQQAAQNWQRANPQAAKPPDSAPAGPVVPAGESAPSDTQPPTQP